MTSTKVIFPAGWAASAALLLAACAAPRPGPSPEPPPVETAAPAPVADPGTTDETASVPPAPVAATPPAAAEADSGVANAQESAPPAQTEEAEAAGPVVDEATRERFSEAIAALNNGDDARAEALLKSVIEAQERLASPHTNLGILYTRQERLEEALAQLQKATELNPDDYVALNYLGIVQRKLGHFTAARDAYQQALKLKPDYPFAHLNIAILFDLYLGELDRALAHYERYQALDGGQNNKLTAWLADLKQRIRSSKEEAQP